MKHIRLGGAIAAIIAVACLSMTAVAQSPVTPSPKGAKVYFINIKNGAVVSSPFLVQFGLSGMGISPAGHDQPNTGHHHLVVDTAVAPAELTTAMPPDAQHIHYGGGQTEAMVTLPPGKHTLQVVFANWTHVPHDPPVMSEVVTITVK